MRRHTDSCLNYLHTLVPAETELQKRSRDKARELGLEGICLSPHEAAFLQFFIESQPSICNFIEVGCLTGLSAQTIFMALPPGAQLWTLEKSPQHAEIAQTIFKELDQSQKQIHLLIGDARETLLTLAQQYPAPFFDAIFIDGNKAAYVDYLDWAEKQLRPGGWIFADNVFLGGGVYNNEESSYSNKQLAVMRSFNQRLSDPVRYRSSLIPTQEGFFVAQKKF